MKRRGTSGVPLGVRHTLCWDVTCKATLPNDHIAAHFASTLSAWLHSSGRRSSAGSAAISLFALAGHHIEYYVGSISSYPAWQNAHLRPWEATRLFWRRIRLDNRHMMRSSPIRLLDDIYTDDQSQLRLAKRDKNGRILIGARLRGHGNFTRFGSLDSLQHLSTPYPLAC